jgi:hypothetical protein
VGQKKIKHLRRLAKSLSPLNINRKEGRTFYGHELISAGTTALDGEDIIPNKLYQSTIINKQALNHSRKIKSIYKKDGDQGVVAYMLEVESIINNTQK